MGPNIVLFRYSVEPEQFVHAMCTLTDPYGHHIKDQMPWQEVSPFPPYQAHHDVRETQAILGG